MAEGRSNRRILVVDDSGLSRRRARTILEELGHVVEEAGDGMTALELFSLNDHELVLLDLVMPGMYGVEVLSRLRELKPDLQVIVVSADIQRLTREEVKAAGAAGMLPKPLSRDELVDTLSVVLNGGTTWSY